MGVKVLDGPLPPGRSGTVVRLAVVLPDVAKARGKWCEVGTYKNPLSANARAVHARRSHGDRYEFASRNVDGRGVLYARLRTEAGK